MPTLKKARKRKSVPTTKGKEKQAIYADKRWKVIREGIKHEYPLCWHCLFNNKTSGTEEVHHIIPWDTGTDKHEQERLAYDWDNVMPLCIKCHKLFHKLLRENAVRYFNIAKRSIAKATSYYGRKVP